MLSKSRPLVCGRLLVYKYKFPASSIPSGPLISTWMREAIIRGPLRYTGNRNTESGAVAQHNSYSCAFYIFFYSRGKTLTRLNDEPVTRQKTRLENRKAPRDRRAGPKGLRGRTALSNVNFPGTFVPRPPTGGSSAKGGEGGCLSQEWRLTQNGHS